MKTILSAILLLLLSPISYSAIDPVVSGDPVNASKFNEIINKVNSTDGISTGAIVPFASASCPAGYLLTNGSAVSRTGITAALFAAIGTSFGSGDGTTTFNLPTTIRCTSEINCQNEFNAKISATGVVSDENLDFINGNCTLITSAFTCPINSGVRTVAMNCVANVNTAGGAYALEGGKDNGTNLVASTYVSAGASAASAQPWSVVCYKQGVDLKPAYKMPSMFTKCIKL